MLGETFSICSLFFLSLDQKGNSLAFFLLFLFPPLTKKAGALVASYVEVAACAAGGARLTRRLRLAYVRSALRQEVSFHDAGGDPEEGGGGEGEGGGGGGKKPSARGPGALLAALSSDADAVQTALSDKLGNAIHHGATFVAGMAVAFARGWSMALMMLATLPLVAAAGGAVSATLEFDLH